MRLSIRRLRVAGLSGEKVHVALLAEQVEDAGEVRLCGSFLKSRCHRLDLRQGRMLTYLREGSGDLLAGEHVIDTAGLDGALRHLRERRLRGVLRRWSHPRHEWFASPLCPSDPVPESSTPTPCCPCVDASEVRKRSITPGLPPFWRDGLTRLKVKTRDGRVSSANWGTV